MPNITAPGDRDRRVRKPAEATTAQPARKLERLRRYIRTMDDDQPPRA